MFLFDSNVLSEVLFLFQCNSKIDNFVGTELSVSIILDKMMKLFEEIALIKNCKTVKRNYCFQNDWI